MAILKKYRNLKSEDNTGFGTSSSGRFFDRSKGGANVGKTGVNILSRNSWYHTLLGMQTGRFLLLLLLIYILINLAFAGVYYLIGIEHLAGVNTGSDFKNFTEVFFFSAQTFTTVGYGRISPVGFMASAVSTFEAFLGLLSFAIATGLFYGRFSRPRAYLHFSNNALISPYKGGIALMLRMSPYKNNSLSEAETKLTLAMQVEEMLPDGQPGGKMINKFYNLDIEISKINTLSLSWTIVHPINEKSPLSGFSESDIKNTRMEIFVFVKAFDEVFSNTVVSRWSYISSEIIWGARYKIMYKPSIDNSKTILDLRKLNEFEKVMLPVIEPSTTN
jgi:inward rectifier potassium channel